MCWQLTTCHLLTYLPPHSSRAEVEWTIIRIQSVSCLQMLMQIILSKDLNTTVFLRQRSGHRTYVLSLVHNRIATARVLKVRGVCGKTLYLDVGPVGSLEWVRREPELWSGSCLRCVRRVLMVCQTCQ